MGNEHFNQSDPPRFGGTSGPAEMKLTLRQFALINSVLSKIDLLVDTVRIWVWDKAWYQNEGLKEHPNIASPPMSIKESFRSAKREQSI